MLDYRSYLICIGPPPSSAEKPGASFSGLSHGTDRLVNSLTLFSLSASLAAHNLGFDTAGQKFFHLTERHSTSVAILRYTGRMTPFKLAVDLINKPLT